MKDRLSTLAAAAVVVAQAGLALAIWRLADQEPIPMQFGFNGEVGRWGDRNEAAVVVAVMAASSGLGLWALPHLSRRRDAGGGELSAARGVLLIATSLASILIAALAFRLLGPETMGGATGMAVFSAIFAAIGAYLGKVGPNPLVGVRTPWTYASRLAWDKANRLAGRLFFWGGLGGLLLAPVAPQPAGFQVVIAGTVVVAAVVVVESWRVWRSDPDRRSAF